MLRLILEQIALFALPFVAFAAFLLLVRRNPLQAEHWEEQWIRLILAGLFIVVASLLITGLTAERHPQGYSPPHLENGRVVPGGFR